MGLAGLRQGPAYLKPSAGGNRKFVPFVAWKDGQSKTVLFTTPIEEVSKVKMHKFIKVPADNEDGFRNEHFMCRKDPAWLDESGGECFICDILGKKPAEPHVAIAVELDAGVPTAPGVTTLTVATKTFKREDGTEVVYPQWGLVQQSFGNFFNYLTAFGQKWGGINHTAFDVSRNGNDKNTSYVFMPLVGSDLPDVNGFDEPVQDLVSLLEEMGSVEKYALLDGSEKLDQSSKFGNDDTYAPTENTNDAILTKFEQLKAGLPADKQDKVESFAG